MNTRVADEDTLRTIELGAICKVKSLDDQPLMLWENRLVKVIGVNKFSIAVTGVDKKGVKRETIFTIDEVEDYGDNLEEELVEDIFYKEYDKGERIYPIEEVRWLRNYHNDSLSSVKASLEELNI